MDKTRRTTRRGDSDQTAMRTIVKGSVVFRGHHYHVVTQRGEPDYTGQLDGMRGLFRRSIGQTLRLYDLYDQADKGANCVYVNNMELTVWRQWVRLDTFEG